MAAAQISLYLFSLRLNALHLFSSRLITAALGDDDAVINAHTCTVQPVTFDNWF